MVTTATYRPLPRAMRRPGAAWSAVPWVLAAGVVLAQISYPLLDGEPLRLVTIGTVLLFFAASVAHAWVHRGAGWALWFTVVTAGGGFLAEALGTATGYPFGDYTYAGSLGPRLLAVPVVVPLAWTMMAYPAFLAGRRLSRSLGWLLAAVALTAWDLFLDPQMVAAGHWSWAHPTPALPGVPGIPLTNYAGWLLVSLVMMGLLDRTLPRRRDASEGQPAALFAWTWLGSAVGNLFFFDRPWVALVGFVAMGLVGLPYLLALWSDRP